MTSLDKKVAVLILLLGLVTGGWVLHRRATSPVGQSATILVDNIAVETVLLRVSSERRLIVVQGVRGESVIEQEGEYIRIIASACPDKLCIKMGRKSRPGEVIVCLPNRVVVRVDGNEN